MNARRFRHCIITGGSSGIGQAIAHRLWQQGSSSITLIARDPIKLQETQAVLEQQRVYPRQQVLAMSADVANQAANQAAIEAAIQRFGPPDLLVLSAGMAHPGHFQTLPIEVFETTMAINYFGSLYSVRAALPAMEQQRQGHIVLISSGAGLVGFYGNTPYSPSKFALRGLAESLRGELRPLGIGLSIAYPPDTDTPQLQAENRTKPLATQKITATAKTWSAAAVADSILRGIQQESFVIAPGLEMGILAKWHSLLAPVLHWYFDRIVTQTRRDSTQ